MRALVQRVTRAGCTVDGQLTGAIDLGLVVLVGASVFDAAADADWLARKVAGLRVFADDAQHMNRDVCDVNGGVLAIPQFTLYGDARRGRRPDFTAAARPEHAEPLYERFCETLAAEGVPVARGVFRAHMKIELVNDGPVTLMIESPRGAGGDATRATED
jgi:D-tyrosyl-tRNA(Tyr) deacylase